MLTVLTVMLTKNTVLKTHLLPALGDKRLDAITNEDVQALKFRLKDRSPKTVNNVLTVLRFCSNQGFLQTFEPIAIPSD